MQILETEHWSLLLPPGWRAVRDEEVVIVEDGDGVGAIEVSTLLHEDGVPAADVLRETFAEEVRDASSCRIGGASGFYRTFMEEGEALREWYLACGSLLLFVTYSCASENAGLDDAAVDEILATLTVDPGLTEA